jgi:hypothetical protein
MVATKEIDWKKANRYLRLSESKFIKIDSPYERCCACAYLDQPTIARTILAVTTRSTKSKDQYWPTRYLCRDCCVKLAAVNLDIKSIVFQNTNTLKEVTQQIKEDPEYVSPIVEVKAIKQTRREEVKEEVLQILKRSAEPISKYALRQKMPVNVDTLTAVLADMLEGNVLNAIYDTRRLCLRYFVNKGSKKNGK